MNENMDARELAFENVISTEEACKIIGRTRQQLYNLIMKGDIEPLKCISRTNMFWKPDIETYLDKRNKETMAKELQKEEEWKRKKEKEKARERRKREKAKKEKERKVKSLSAKNN